MEENIQQVSKYSSGVNINLRVDALWKDSHFHSRTGQYNKWNLDLDCIWSELARDLKDEKGKEGTYEEKQVAFDKFDEEILEHGVINDKEPEGFRVKSKDDKEIRDAHYRILRKKQLFLTRIENKLGKGTTWNDNDEDDID